MMISKQVSLENISLAIKMNCLVDHEADRPLMLLKLPGVIKNRTMGRTLFIFLALQSGHTPHSIRFFLDMSPIEYETKMRKLPELLDKGRFRYETDPNGPEDLDLFFYRKLMLIASYLRYNHQYETSFSINH